MSMITHCLQDATCEIHYAISGHYMLKCFSRGMQEHVIMESQEQKKKKAKEIQKKTKAKET